MGRGSTVHAELGSEGDIGVAATILFPFIGGDIIGGSHVSALTIARHLDRKRFEPSILVHGPAGRLGSYIHDLGLEFWQAPNFPIMAPAYSHMNDNASVGRYMFQTLWALRRVVRDSGAAIVHTNDGRMHVNWSLPARLGGARHLWHHREDPKSRGANWIAPLLADRILCVSHFAKPKQAARVLGDRIQVVRSPFIFVGQPPDRTAERTALLAEIGAQSQAVIIGYVGGLITRKRPDFFVEVVKQTIAALPDREVHGVLFGEVDRPDSTIPDMVRVKASELGIRDRIHLLGQRIPIAGPMAALDTLVISALNEPFGRTLIEAMDLRVPVVATRHGGNFEAITDGINGFLVPPSEAGAFAERIARLNRDPERREEIVATAYRRVHADFGVAKSVAAVEQCYEGLLRASRHRQVAETVG